MTAPSKPDLARGMQHAIDLFEQKSDRLAAMNDADFEQAMSELPPPSRVPSAEELVAGAKTKAKGQAAQAGVIALPERPARRAPWIPWLVAAALGAVAVTLLIERRELTAWLFGPQAPLIGPAPDEPRERTPQQKAEAMRVEADDACARELWGRCQTRLDEAKALDPAGEATPRAQGLRAAIDAHTAHGDDKKPKK
jgi:hypothetical protein